MSTPPVALTIAGSDSGGGAGIQADLRVFGAFGAYGCSVLTAVTAQNTVGVHGVLPVPPDFVDRQLGAVLSDLPVAAVKTGMLAGADTARLLARRAAAGGLPNLVVDPVLRAGTGAALADPETVAVYRDELFPHATVVTPNLAETGALLGAVPDGVDQMADAAAELAARTGAACVVVKGGHLAESGPVPDAVRYRGRSFLLTAPRVATGNSHGTGCTLSAAIAAGLAAGRPVPDALAAAKDYLTRALRASSGWRLGAGTGPLNHLVEGETHVREQPSSDS